MSEALREESPRAKAHRLLTREEGGAGGHWLRTGLVLLIVLSVTTAVLKSVPAYGREHGDLLDRVLLLTTFGFAVEFLLRVWIAPENPGAGQGAGAGLRERLRYVFSLPGLVDLLAGIPFALAPLVGLNLDWLDIVPIFKLLRHTAAFQFMVEAVYSERRVLGSAAVLMLALLVFQSSLVYYFERDAQPDKYGSIPAAMWWGIVTLTTIGYGDMAPITAGGRWLGAIVAVLGIGMFALPAGLLGAAFVDELGKARLRLHQQRDGKPHCPHCGADLQTH